MNLIKQLRYTLLISSLLSPSLVLAEKIAKPEQQATLERIENKIDGIASQSEQATRIYVQQPLGDRTRGFEFNFFRLLLLGTDEQALSGTYSFFNTKNNTEIALPFMLSRSDYMIYHGDESADHNKKMTSFTLDVHYRKYLGHSLDGFYISAFTRAAILNGVQEPSAYYYDRFQPSSYSLPGSTTEFKLGLGFGIGYRIISDSGYYWGASLSAGRYLFGDSNVYIESEGISTSIDDEEFIFDIELLKFGFAF